MKTGSIFSIGYSSFGNDAAQMIEILNEHEINVLIDVRSSPYSSYYTAFNKENLELSLKKENIYYRNYAKEFGARQEDLDLYPFGYLDFERFSKTDEFKSGVTRVENSLAHGYNVVFMCSEKEPVSCHRAILVTRAFSNLGYQITHLLPEKKSKTQADIETELLQMHPRSLFDDFNEDEIVLAYRKQNEKIGFHMEDL